MVGPRPVKAALSSRIEPRWPIWAARFLRAWSLLVRTRVLGLDGLPHTRPFTVAHWHEDHMILLPRFGSLGLTTLVSQSRDGERMARAAHYLGYRITRGSSTRGAVGGLLALLRALRKGQDVVLAVDGPQGPKGVCKPGIVTLAQKSGAPLFPVGVAATPKIVFKRSWDQVYLPFPFGRQVFVVAPPLWITKEAGADVENQCRRVEEALRQARLRAQAILGRERILYV